MLGLHNFKNMSTVLITGGTGLIGKALTNLLVGHNYDVIILTRSAEGKSHQSPRVSFAEWDVEKQTIDEAAVAKADHLVHLAGAGVADERWTNSRKNVIRSSRIQTGKLLVKTLASVTNKIQTVVSASAIGWYGSDENLPAGKIAFTENMPSENSFLGETCRLWEESIKPVEEMGKRLVILRTGIVLGNDGGAFKEFKLPVKFGVAAVLGSGKQVVSWIHIQDICRMYLAAIENQNLQGAYNAAGPHPVTNKTLTLTLAETMKGKYYVPIHVPAFILNLVLGAMSVEVLKSATISSEKIETTGFHFQFPDITPAVQELTKN